MSILPTYQAFAYHHAADVPTEVVRALYQHEAEANVILPFLLKARHFPLTGTAVGTQLWIAVFDNAKNVDFVLSCTKGPMGNYPVFIVACKSAVQLAEEESCGRDICDALSPLVGRLLEHVLPQRVFSVFAIASVAKRFAEVFEEEMRARGVQGIRAIPDAPLYDATFTFCTRETFTDSEALCFAPARKGTEDIVINICRADPKHLPGLAAMCKAFSETSPPYVLDDQRAEEEAATMIKNQQVWVHTIQKDGDPPEIACLVATTRESDHVTAITKVFTPEKWRSRGCAQRLMHRVCQEILSKDERKRLVLYVGNSEELAPARGVYHKLGFQGLNVRAPSGAAAVPGVERWLEIGFEGTILGYW